MDLKLIKNLLNLIAESEVNEVSIEEGDFKIKVKKTGAAEPSSYPPMPFQYQMPAPQQYPQQAAPQAASPTAEIGSGGQADKAASQEIAGEVVKSPIVGTFYEAPNPDAEPFVKVGDHVEKGQTLCIVEAMKIMNEIESEVSGEIKKILVRNAEPVEFDQPLFIIG